MCCCCEKKVHSVPEYAEHKRELIPYEEMVMNEEIN